MANEYAVRRDAFIRAVKDPSNYSFEGKPLVTNGNSVVVTDADRKQFDEWYQKNQLRFIK